MKWAVWVSEERVAAARVVYQFVGEWEALVAGSLEADWQVAWEATEAA